MIRTEAFFLYKLILNIRQEDENIQIHQKRKTGQTQGDGYCTMYIFDYAFVENMAFFQILIIIIIASYLKSKPLRILLMIKMLKSVLSKMCNSTFN